MDSAQQSSQLVRPLPSGFSSIQQVRNLPNEVIIAGSLVNVIGFVKDQQEPKQTRGTDAKYTLEIMDHSIQYETHGLKVVIFRPMEEMPRLSGVADVVLIRNAKVQMWSGTVSLLTHHTTEFHLLESSKIPKVLSAANTAQWASYPSNKTPPKIPETSYVIWAHNRVGELDLPSDTEYQERSIQSRSIKDKNSLLKDVKDDCFYNLLGEVIKVHDGLSGSLTMYLSDYTANSNFFHRTWVGAGDANDGVTYDDYGYVKSRSKPKKANEWPGPYGKMSIQITLFDGHASFVRESVKVHEWVVLSNVHVKYGKVGGYLEGFLRGDQNAFDGKVQVTVLRQVDEPGDIHLRWKEAIRRKLEWEKKFEQEKQPILDEAAGLGDKRKRGNDEPSKLNSRRRRQEKRATNENKAIAAEQKRAKQLDLNHNIRCAFPDEETVSISQILKPQGLHLENQECDCPFTLSKYRANVRVVDYFPHKIEDFAVGRRASEFDMLSDYSGGEDTDPEEDMLIFKSGKGFKKNVWEWRFALKVEDAETKNPKDRIWLMVDNQAAQGLLGLEDDATNLRGDPTLLDQLKEQLFKLWGDLEEQKSAALQQSTTERQESPPSSFETNVSASFAPRKAGAMPALEDSDSENGQSLRISSAQKSSSSVLKERNPNVNATLEGSETSNTALKTKNKAFTCCIKQYGVKVDEDDPLKANAGNGQRWQRMFALFGTQIM